MRAFLLPLLPLRLCSDWKVPPTLIVDLRRVCNFCFVAQPLHVDQGYNRENGLATSEALWSSYFILLFHLFKPDFKCLHLWQCHSNKVYQHCTSYNTSPFKRKNSRSCSMWKFPGEGVKSELQLPAYTTATAAWIRVASATYTSAHDNARSLIHSAGPGVKPSSS